MDINQIKEILEKWKEVLKVQDWDIDIKIIEEKWRKSADIKILSDCKQAILMINSDPQTKNLDELVIHELLHLKLWGMDQMLVDLLEIVYPDDNGQREFAETQFFRVLEPTVHDLTRGYLELSNKGPSCMKSLDKQVASEVEQGK